MKADVLPSEVKIWYGFLQIAIRQGLPINPDFYSAWGTTDEIQSTKFQQWWKQKGMALFDNAVPIVSVVEATEDFVTVRVPTSLSAVQIKQQVSALIANQRGTKRLKKRAALSFHGDVKYKRLKQYERFLEIEFDPKNAGKTVEEKTELLRNVYRKIKSRLDKRAATLKAGKKRGAEQFKARDPDSFVTGAEIRKGINSKKVSRWRLSGKMLLLNVAEGSFPGKDYYGAQLAKKLQQRLDKIGIKDIGAVVRNAGGGQRKSDLSHVRLGISKREAEKRSLKAYGKGKNSNPVGSTEG